MDELIVSPTNYNEIYFAKLFRNFLNKYYKDTLAKSILLKVLDKRNVMYINTVGYGLYTDMFYDIFGNLSGIYSYKTILGSFHSLGVYPPNDFYSKISLKNEFECDLINDINKSLIKHINRLAKSIKRNHIDYITKKSLLDKSKKMNQTQKLIFFRNNVNLPDDVIGIIGNFIQEDFSTYLVNLIELSEINLNISNLTNAFFIYDKITKLI